MEVEDSNDVESIASSTEENATYDRPLLRLIKRLINMQDNKQKTVLTNTQLIHILQKEFQLQVRNLHVLELEIYMNVMKKFLKDWPQWDEFDQKMSTKSKEISMDKILEAEYLSLKEYLNNMLEASKTLAKEAVEKFKKETASLTKDATKTDSSSGDVVMKVQCTQSQLHNLFFKCPNPKLNNSIFNVEPPPARISVMSLTLNSILERQYVSVQITAKDLSYSRATAHKLKHVLRNRKLTTKFNIQPIDTRLEIKYHNKLGSKVVSKKAEIKSVINQLFYKNSKKIDENETQVANLIRRMIMSDLKDLPEMINLQATYRKYCCQYPYVRLGAVECDNYGESKYDLALEETIMPAHTYTFSRQAHGKGQNLGWLTIQCDFCCIKFNGFAVYDIQQHFNDNHQFEMSWRCTKCCKMFNNKNLTKARWQHGCSSPK